MVEVLAGVANPIEQDHYLNLAADRLMVDPAALRRMLRPVKSGGPARIAPAGHLAETGGNPHDEYLLALLMRLRELPEPPPVPGEVEFVLAENRALYRSFGGEIPAELQPFAERVDRYRADVERLPPHRLADEIEQTRNAIRVTLLEAKRRELNALLREGADEAEVAQLLVQTARQLPPERESVGTR